MDILSQMNPNDEVSITGDFMINGIQDYDLLIGEEDFDVLQNRFGNKNKNIKKILLKNTRRCK